MKAKLEHLFSGMFSDEIDKMGWREQVVRGFLLNRPELKCYGPMRTVKLETKATNDENIQTGLGFIEKLEAGEILVVQGSQEFAYFGELMTRLSRRQKLGGVVIEGLTRDNPFTQRLTSLPIFTRGYSPKDIKGRGRVEAVDVPVTLGHLRVEPHDWLFGDSDGIVVIPASHRRKLEKRVETTYQGEADIIKRIDAGESIRTILQFHKSF